MPEGDTLYRTATTLRKAIGGKRITHFEVCQDDIAGRAPHVGTSEDRFIHAVEARGKHLLIVMRLQNEPSDPIPVSERLDLKLLRNDLVLHTHLRMTGSWHIYRHGERWQKPERYMKALIETEEFVVPCFSAPVVELLSAREAARHPQLAQLGPDAITEEFDAAAAMLNLRSRGELEISVAIMNQRAMAGVGNVFKSEVLFIRRISPFRKVRDLSDEELRALIAECHRLLKLNRDNAARRTHYSLDNRQLLWVYGRVGKACRICGTEIKVTRQGYEARVTFWCPSCQS